MITTPQLAALECSNHQAMALVDRGRLVRVQRGVFRAADWPLSESQEWAIACAATAGVLCGQSAGRFWEFRKVPRPALPEVVVARLSRSATTVARVRRTGRIEPTDIVRRSDGLVVTTPVRTAFDLAASLSAASLESVIEQGLDRRLFTVRSLIATGVRLAAPGRAGSRRFLDVVGSRPAYLQPVDSDLEMRFERALHRAGAPQPVRQHAVRLDGRVTVHCDFAWPRHQLAVEVDHSVWHASREASNRDKWRDRKLGLLGWHLVRVTEDDLRERMTETAADVVTLLALRTMLAS